jgi:putative Ca2+/H+ antiporter (TMEM165/GDT1 family)
VKPAVIVAVFPIIFLGELPDKSMFASVVMATKGRSLQVWLGAAAAFAVHVAIATTIGVGLFHLLPHRVIEALVAVLFGVGAVYSWREGAKGTEVGLVQHEAAAHAVFTTAFVVIFLAEWGDLTQILTANLAVQYHSPLSVAIGAVAALWLVAALAVVSGQGLLRSVPVATVRKAMSAVLVVLALVAAWSALR